MADMEDAFGGNSGAGSNADAAGNVGASDKAGSKTGDDAGAVMDASVNGKSVV